MGRNSADFRGFHGDSLRAGTDDYGPILVTPTGFRCVSGHIFERAVHGVIDAHRPKLLLGGAAGNFIDRIDGHGVVDYMHTGWFATFNLADVFVTTGVAVRILGTILSPRSRNGD
ncbi:hypothetical protein E3O23_13990 [Cryobacterium tagatosivorans]|uniref:Uncharacterized protein n=1 Tax=Cryobacterium tagatosivorans TaxID=1259199 RepID=A0A4R8UDR5_9MICO|nr:hypothetical protein E3O23_13990 [Cryobacterium tagatosivorans]